MTNPTPLRKAASGPTVLTSRKLYRNYLCEQLEEHTQRVKKIYVYLDQIEDILLPQIVDKVANGDISLVRATDIYAKLVDCITKMEKTKLTTYEKLVGPESEGDDPIVTDKQTQEVRKTAELLLALLANKAS